MNSTIFAMASTTIEMMLTIFSISMMPPGKGLFLRCDLGADLNGLDGDRSADPDAGRARFGRVGLAGMLHPLVRLRGADVDGIYGFHDVLRHDFSPLSKSMTATSFARYLPAYSFAWNFL